MQETNKMHYLSKMISRNFLPKNSSRTFLEFNPEKGKIEDRNIKNLFSKCRPWGQEFEHFLSGNNYENCIAPLLKELVAHPIKRKRILKNNGFQEAQFNAEEIVEKDKQNILSKLFLQTVLLQRSKQIAEAEIEQKLTEVFLSNMSNITEQLKLLLVEIHPQYICPPLILTDGMCFAFVCPNNNKKSLGHIGFMFPISEKRFLLWISKIEDYYYFGQKYSDINYLNLCRIEEHDKKCTIALGKTERNEMYLQALIRQIPFFSSGDNVKIHTTREWR